MHRQLGLAEAAFGARQHAEAARTSLSCKRACTQARLPGCCSCSTGQLDYWDHSAPSAHWGESAAESLSCPLHLWTFSMVRKGTSRQLCSMTSGR